MATGVSGQGVPRLPGGRGQVNAKNRALEGPARVVGTVDRKSLPKAGQRKDRSGNAGQISIAMARSRSVARTVITLLPIAIVIFLLSSLCFIARKLAFSASGKGRRAR
jgi:hypothetical protein